MGHYRCLTCEHRTGLTITACPQCGGISIEHCTCGSGGHPWRCLIHPDEYQRHIDELNAEPDDEQGRRRAGE